MNKFYHPNIIGMGLTMFIVMNKSMPCSLNCAAKLMQVLEYANIYLFFFHKFLVGYQKRGIPTSFSRVKLMMLP